MKTAFQTLAAAVSFLILATACSHHDDPEYAEIRYSVDGTAENVRVTVVTDEHGTVETFDNVSLPWKLTYETLTRVMLPPVYLYLEVTSRPAAIATGTSDVSAPGLLADGLADFTGIAVGDVAAGGGGSSAVTAVAPTSLTLTPGDDFFSAGGVAYQIYAMRSLTGSAYGTPASTGIEETIATLTVENWDVLSAVFAIHNYTAP